MSELIVNCAGCGKRYRGVPGKSYKCSACANLFTIPPAAKMAAVGKVLCSQCWNEFEQADSLNECPECGENISIAHGGGKAAIAPAKASGLSTSVKVDEHEKAILDLKAQLAEAAAKLASANEAANKAASERDQALADAERDRFERIEAEAKLGHFQDAAVAALEPLGVEYTRRMRELIAEAEGLRAQTRQFRDETIRKAEQIERAATELKNKMNTVCCEINEQLSEVLGVPNHVIAETEQDEGSVSISDSVPQLVAT